MNTFRFRHQPGLRIFRCLFACLAILGLMIAGVVEAAPAASPTSAPSFATGNCGGDFCVYLPAVHGPDYCQVGQIIPDPVDDVSPAYIDVTSLSSSFSGTSLTVTFKIRDVPPSLTFNRIGVSQNYLEYGWSVHVDVDNNPATGYPNYPYKGAEIMISADHFVSNPNTPVLLPIANGVQTNTWIYNSSIGGWSFGTWATLVVDPQANTMRMTGTIPGLTANSRLLFETYDYNPGGSRLIDLSACSDSPAPAGANEAPPADQSWQFSRPGRLLLSYPGR